MAFLDDWKRLGAHALESFGKLEDAFKTVLNNMKKLESVEKLYGKKKTKHMVRQARMVSGGSKKLKAKSDARSKASKEKSAHLNRWRDCMKAARQNLGIVGNAFPKKGTDYYDECVHLMKENR